MAVSCGDDNDDNLYFHLINDHKKGIIEEMDMDQIMKMFPHKEAISESDIKKIISEAEEKQKNKKFIKHLLERRHEHELNAFVEIFLKGNISNYLKVIINDRLKRAEQDRYKTDKRRLEKDLETAQNTIREQIKEIKNLSEDKKELTKQLEDAHQEIERMKTRLESFETLTSESQDQLRENVEDHKVKIEELTEEMDCMRKELNSLKKSQETNRSKSCLIL